MGDFDFELLEGATIIAAGLDSDGGDSSPSITGTGLGGNLEIRFLAGVPSNTSGFAQVEIDNIVVTEVPEPATAALIGLGTLAVLSRRRQH